MNYRKIYDEVAVQMKKIGAYGEDLKDATQEGICKALEADLRSNDERVFQYYALRSARTAFLRSRTKEEFYPEGVHVFHVDSIIAKLTVDAMLSRIHPRYRKLIELDMQGYDGYEIAQMMGWSYSTVRTRKSETLKKLANV